MSLFKKTIFYAFNPNMKRGDFFRALAFLIWPIFWFRWQKGSGAKQVEDWFEKKYQRLAYSFDSGRSALFVALKAAQVSSGDVVLVQGYTCSVVLNAIKATGAKPRFIDIDETLNIDIESLKKNIDPSAKVLIVQHTFGRPAKMREIMEIARAHNLTVIEDCAHALGGDYQGQLLGTFGEMAIFSFGSGKIVSSIRGGVLLANTKSSQEVDKLFAVLKPFPRIQIFRHLMHYPIFYLAKPLYSFYLGKAILFLANKLGLLAKIMDKDDKRGEGGDRVFLYPNALAQIVLPQLKNLKNNLAHRAQIFKIYQSELPDSKKVPDGGACLYYPYQTSDPRQLVKLAKKKNILLGLDWSLSPIVPPSLPVGPFGYKAGTCPTAERIVAHLVTLPTSVGITAQDAKKIVTFINSVDK